MRYIECIPGEYYHCTVSTSTNTYIVRANTSMSCCDNLQLTGSRKLHIGTGQFDKFANEFCKATDDQIAHFKASMEAREYVEPIKKDQEITNYEIY